jgi:hypothetical protein
MRNARILFGKPEERRPFGSMGFRWIGIITMDLKGISFEGCRQDTCGLEW